MKKKGIWDGVRALWPQPLSSPGARLVNILRRRRGGCLGSLALRRPTPRLLSRYLPKSSQSVSAASTSPICWSWDDVRFLSRAGGTFQRGTELDVLLQLLAGKQRFSPQTDRKNNKNNISFPSDFLCTHPQIYRWMVGRAWAK